MAKYPGIWDRDDLPEGLNHIQQQDIKNIQTHGAQSGGWGWNDMANKRINDYLKREGFKKVTRTEWSRDDDGDR